MEEAYLCNDLAVVPRVGRHHFRLDDSVAEGRFRPPRDPTEIELLIQS